MASNRPEAYPQDWLKTAEADLRRVGRRLQEHDTEDAAVHLQQALEKFLKGYLLARGWSLKKIHDLEALLDDAVKHDPALERYRPLVAVVTGYYLPARYPSIGRSPTRAEVSKAAAEAVPLAKLLRLPPQKR